MALVDSRELSRALANLLTNAIRHTPPDGAVTVETHSGPGTAVISVADQCGGIPDADLARVFDPGWRGTQARTPLPGEGGCARGRHPPGPFSPLPGVQPQGGSCYSRLPSRRRREP